MTSEQVKLTAARISRLVVPIVLLAVASGTLSGCGPKKYAQPNELSSPYPDRKLWAVAPFRNESGTTVVDTTVMADKLNQQLSQVRGITLVPVNRVIEAMGALGLKRIESTHDAMELMHVLDTDGLIVGTVSAWDPYEPMKIGATVSLYSRAAHGSSSQVDPRKLRRASTPDGLPGLVVYRQPIAEAGGFYDAANGKVLANLQKYAMGRAPHDSPAGWRRYLLNMDLYAEFVSHELTRGLFYEEWDRMTELPPVASPTGFENLPQDQNRP